MFNSFQYIQKSSYSALKFYNIRSEVAISAVKNNNVVLFSTLDSLQHNTLQYSVLPDLRQYASDTKVQFQVIANEEKRNRIIELNGTKIMILESKVKELPTAVDFILWRKNNYSDIGLLQELSPNAIFIIDGSNSDKTIDRVQRAFQSNPERLYILKNNFAYVWDEEY
ncbi:hypothetical protein [Sphingobacterium bovistauri]|uniref:Uncharacterized protein n=1 Tax=Sphingobacterium bovistauri TaxID=2781959 RepID=A0ABS7Z833_9SPHI|nr:hypothetical protein [Sphingobacterium bovistauri]MCA5005576.1 hypothetical protein [Sphingobacterium bovistauri]